MDVKEEHSFNAKGAKDAKQEQSINAEDAEEEQRT
jgi:hypothetical protein